MKNIKDTTREERKLAVAAYIKARVALDRIDLEMAQITQANNGHFIEYGD